MAWYPELLNKRVNLTRPRAAHRRERGARSLSAVHSVHHGRRWS
jgi:hypothetical protein